MPMETIKLGGYVDEEVKKINDNFALVPTCTSDLTNDSGFPADGNYVHTDNNFSNADKSKLDGIAAGAEVNVQPDWNATSGDGQILNKPTIPTVPTNISSFTNDAGYQTATQVNTTVSAAVGGKVDKIAGKDLSENDYTDEDAAKVAKLGTVTFTASSFGAVQSDGLYHATLSAAGKNPVMVMRSNGSDYEQVLVHTKVSGNNIIIIAAETFAGYVITA